MSPLLSQDWQLKGDGGMQCADCIGWNCGNEGNVTPEGEKRLCSSKCRLSYYQNFLGFFCLALVLQMWSVLVFRSAK